MSGNKNAYITGAAGGIGSAVAKAFADRGYNVVVMWHKMPVCTGEKGAGAVQIDVADYSSVDRAFDEAERIAGPADVLVNNAGVSHFGLLQECSEEDYDRVMDVNLKGVFNCCKRVLPGMINRKSGSIINISSMWGIAGASCESIYSASKFGVVGLTKSLAKEVGPSGITVNCIAPGVIDTKMNAHLDDAAKAELIESTPLGRIGTPEDVAGAAVFLAEAPFVTGQVLSVDGGILL